MGQLRKPQPQGESGSDDEGEWDEEEKEEKEERKGRRERGGKIDVCSGEGLAGRCKTNQSGLFLFFFLTPPPCKALSAKGLVS